mmetsp:Transcript_32134/g.102223  ORF Transcript_32134/g.102223 Transcript_32134/m.102223 type:complete len:245 (-) Transcript_32134:1146-1880(-)
MLSILKIGRAKASPASKDLSCMTSPCLCELNMRRMSSGLYLRFASLRRSRSIFSRRRDSSWRCILRYMASRERSSSSRTSTGSGFGRREPSSSGMRPFAIWSCRRFPIFLSRARQVLTRRFRPRVRRRTSSSALSPGGLSSSMVRSLRSSRWIRLRHSCSSSFHTTLRIFMRSRRHLRKWRAQRWIRFTLSTKFLATLSSPALLWPLNSSMNLVTRSAARCRRQVRMAKQSFHLSLSILAAKSA